MKGGHGGIGSRVVRHGGVAGAGFEGVGLILGDDGEGGGSGGHRGDRGWGMSKDMPL